MNDARAKTGSEQIAKAVQNVANVAEEKTTWSALVARQDDEGRRLLRELDMEHSEAVLAAEERVLEIAGRICRQFGRLELFELIYLATTEEVAPKTGDGVRWLEQRGPRTSW